MQDFLWNRAVELLEVSAPKYVVVQVAWSPSPAVAEARIVMPPCATSDVLPDQYVTMEILTLACVSAHP